MRFETIRYRLQERRGSLAEPCDKPCCYLCAAVEGACRCPHLSPETWGRVLDEMGLAPAPLGSLILHGEVLGPRQGPEAPASAWGHHYPRASTYAGQMW